MPLISPSGGGMGGGNAIAVMRPAGPTQTSFGVDTSSVYGSIIPLSAGRRKVSGVPIWAGPFRNTAGSEVTALVPLGGSSVIASYGTQIAKTIVGNFAIAFGAPLALPAERLNVGILRLWANGVLVYDASNFQNALTFPGINFTVYEGSETQLPDSAISADKGDLTPAHRGLIYVVFRDFPTGLLGSGLTIPTFEAELSDGLEYNAESQTFTNLSGYQSDEGPAWVDWADNSMYSTDNTSGYHLHKYDLDAQAEVQKISVTAMDTHDGDPFGGFGEAYGHIAVDEVSKNVYFPFTIANTVPYVEMNYQSGAVTKVWAESSTRLSPRTDAEGHTTPGDGGSVPYPSGGMCLVDGNDNGNRSTGLIIGTLIDDICAVTIGAGPEGMRFEGKLAAGANIFNITQYPLLSRPDYEQRRRETQFVNGMGSLPNNSPSQMGAAIVCAGSKAFMVYVGFGGGRCQIGGTHMFANVANHNVIFALVDQSDWGIVLFCQHTVNLTWRAIKFQVSVTSNYHSNAGGYLAKDGNGDIVFISTGPTAGLVPSVWTAGSSPGINNPVQKYNVAIPDYNGGGAHYQAIQQSRARGTFVWVDGPDATLLSLSSGTYKTVPVEEGVSGSFFWDPDRNRLHCVDNTHAFDLFMGVGGGASPTLDRVLTWLAVSAGYAEADIEVDAELDDPVLGIYIDQTYKTQQLFYDMGKVYDFQCFESGGKIKFVRTAAGDDFEAAAVLTTNDLAPIAEGDVSNGELLVTTFPPPSEVPIGITLNYIDPAMDYDVGAQSYSNANSIDPLQASTTSTALNIPIVMTTSEAHVRVTKIVLAGNAESVTQQFRLPWRFLRLEPADGITITVHGFQYAVRLDQVTINGDKTMSLFGRNYNYNANVDPGTDDYDGGLPQTVPSGNLSGPVALDIPLLSAADEVTGVPQFYTGVAARLQGAFTGAVLRRAITGGAFGDLFLADRQVPSGIAASLLPATTTPHSTDEVTELTIVSRSLVAGDIDSTDEDGLLAYSNLAAIGAPGRWELVSFRTVEVVNAKTFKLTGLLRGRRGTEVNTDSHVAGDQFLLLQSVAVDFRGAITLQPDALAAVDAVSYTWRAVGLGTFETAAYDFSAIARGNNLRPWAPADYIVELAVGDDLDISWQRRSRIAESDTVEDPPLGETTEEYELEILDGSGTVVRTVEGLTSPAYTYVAADQTTDGFAPPLTELQMRVYQISSTVGRGFTRTETVDVV